MYMFHDYYTVYCFPKGVKRLAMNLSGLELKQLTLKYGTPIKVTYSYEEVVKENIK